MAAFGTGAIHSTDYNSSILNNSVTITPPKRFCKFCGKKLASVGTGFYDEYTGGLVMSAPQCVNRSCKDAKAKKAAQ